MWEAKSYPIEKNQEEQFLHGFIRIRKLVKCNNTMLLSVLKEVKDFEFKCTGKSIAITLEYLQKQYSRGVLKKRVFENMQ